MKRLASLRQRAQTVKTTAGKWSKSIERRDREILEAVDEGRFSQVEIAEAAGVKDSYVRRLVRERHKAENGADRDS